MTEVETVSIFCLTYNHKKYIKDALDGFLVQNTNFPIKVFIYDDASTDETQDIIREYKNRYPEMITAYLSDTNNYTKENDYTRFLRDISMPYLQGKYIACCEGDDYWIDPDKLQIQVEYMEKHPDCALCAHASEWIDYRQKKQYEYHPYDSSRDLTDDEVILQTGGNLSSATLLIRRDAYFYDDRYPCADVGDVTLQWYALTKGKIHYIDKVMSTYRYYHNGSWSQVNGDNGYKYFRHAVRMLNFLDDYEIYTNGNYNGLIRQKKDEYYRIGINSYYRYMDDAEDRIMDNILPDADRYAKEIVRICKSSRGDLQIDCSENERREHMVIYGHGMLSGIVRDYLDRMGINWDGYVISDGQEDMIQEREKPVWQLSKYPYPHRNTTIIVGVGQQYKKEIEESLSGFEIGNLIAPFWYDV